MPNSIPAIEICGLSKNFGDTHALVDLTVTVAPGQVFGFLGPNGSGKTTAIRCLMDEIRPTAGSARILNLDTHTNSVAIRRQLGYLPGDLVLYSNLSGKDILQYFANLRGGVDQNYVDELAERLGAHLDKKVGDLSTGNRQKIGIIQAFMNKPDLIIFDEPSAGLDPLVQRELQAMIRELADRGGSVFLSSHSLSEVQRVADLIGILRQGSLIALEPISSMRAKGIRKVELELDKTPERSTFSEIQGVRDVLVEGNRVFLSYEGTMDKLLAVVTQHCQLIDVSTNEADLEEVFLTYYHEIP